MRENNVCRTAVEGTELVLAAALGSDVGRQASIDDDILLPCVLIDFQTSDDEETVAEVQLVGEVAKLRVQLRNGESVFCNMRDRETKC